MCFIQHVGEEEEEEERKLEIYSRTCVLLCSRLYSRVKIHNRSVQMENKIIENNNIQIHIHHVAQQL